MSDSSHSSHCQRCGAAMPNAPEGLCPRCLMAQVMQPTQTDSAAGATPPLTPEEIAPHFPQLEILESLGRGGMGVVYKARQKSLNRLVALKLLAPERADDPHFAARFEKEAQALAALNHPHIVGVYDFGQAGGFYYLLMEFVDGVNLRQLLLTKHLTPKEALSIVPPVCDALQCAHDHGIVHRDIKPENLLIDKAGKVKIADFGVAKILGAAPSDIAPSALGHDVASQAFGTPDYAAPEQANGQVDHRADIYSLGVVLYEMLTGERPKDKLEAPSKRVQMDIRIDEIVLRALEKTPGLRFATAAEFRTQVEAVTQEFPSPVAPTWSPPEAGWGWLVGKMFGITFRSRRAFLLANLSALGFLAFLGFVPLPGWKGCFGFAGFFGLIGVAFMVELSGQAVTSSKLRRTLGGMMLLLAAALLLGAQVMNRFVDDFGVTKDARARLEHHRKLAQASSAARAAATDAVDRLQTARHTQDNPEIGRLTREANEAHERSMQADMAVHQAAAMKQASEQQRLTQYSVLAGLLAIAGMLTLLTTSRHSKQSDHVSPASNAPMNPWPQRIFILLAALVIVPVVIFLGLLVPVYQSSRVVALEARQTLEAKQREIEKARTADEQPPATDLSPGSKTAPALTTTIQGTMSDADLQKLSWHEFDQTPGKFWRELADVRRFKEAAELIERMLSLHPELEPINASNLHFHAGQCWAMAGEKQHALTQLKLSHHPSATTAGLRWNDYVRGTQAFLTGDKQKLLNAHESLAESDPVNKPNLCVLDRLLASFGKSYAEAYETDGQDHQKLSVDSFNRAWELLDKKDRTKEDDDRMMSLAHASLAHWRMRKDCTDRNLSIGYWQLSRVYAVLAQGTNAERYGGLCLRVSEKEPPFYLGYAHEALARAALLNERKELFEKHLTEAKSLAAKVSDADERKALEDDLTQLVWKHVQ